jgi:L-threonylcarbamoyladenylate synthase
MSAEVVCSDPQEPEAAIVAQAAAALREGGLIVLPTDTVYGLACRADDEAAVRRLFALKRRSAEKALPILLADAERLNDVASVVPEAAERLAEAYWPGPLTLIVRKASAIPDLVTGGKDTVGVRVPDLPLARAILAACDFPVAVTSANLADEPPAVSVAELPIELRAAVALIVDRGTCSGGTPSTVVDVTVEPPAVLREGPVTAEDIKVRS